MSEQQILAMLSKMASDEGLTLEQLVLDIKEQRENAKANEALAKDVEEFNAMFPDVAPDSIPDSVWEKVSQGNPLAAAYALYVCGNTDKENKAKAVNEENSKRSAPVTEESDGETTFTPEQVDGMSAANVKKNFKNIIKSMKSWKI